MKLLLLSTVMALLAVPALGQIWTGGVKAGAAVMTFSGDSKSSLDPAVGWAGGLALGYDFGNGFVVQPELLYVVKGAYADIDLDGLPVRARSEIRYVEVPLLLMYRYPHGELRPMLYAGPMAASKLDASIYFRARGSDREQREDDLTVEEYDYGVVVGAGLEWDVRGQRLLGEVRGSFGLANARQIEPPLRNTGVIFLIGLMF